MIHIALRTEYSFKQTYSPIKELVEYAKENEMTELGIADIGNTFGHFSFNKQCKDAGIKPIFGVRLNTLPDNSKQRTCGLPWIYLAKNNEGLKELYRLTKTSYDKFYYTPRIFFKDLLSVSENIAVLSPFRIGLNALLGDITPSTLDYLGGFIYYDIRKEKEIPVDNHNYLNKEDREVYQVLAGVNKRGDGYIHKFESKTYPQHLLTNEEHSYEFNSRDYWDNAKELALECNAELNHAEMVKAPFKRDIVKECEKGAKRLDIDLSDPVYEERINREISIIKERGFTDYFFIVSDMLIEAKKTMLVGPGRGCFLPGQKVLVKIGNGHYENINIENVKIGSMVMTPYGKVEFVNNRFKYSIEEEIIDIELDNGKTVSCTQDHKILTYKGWKQAKDLNPDDEICEINKNTRKIAHKIRNGWPLHLAHQISNNGYINYNDYIEGLGSITKTSKINVKLTCKSCGENKEVQIRRLQNRSHNLANEPICNDCILSIVTNTKEWKQNNSNAQLVAQNKPEQIFKNAIAQIKRHNKDWCNSKYDSQFHNPEYKQWIRYDYYKDTCQLCQATGDETRMELHHIDGNKNSNPDNLILLCGSCHSTYHNNERYNDKWMKTKFLLKGIAEDLLCK